MGVLPPETVSVRGVDRNQGHGVNACYLSNGMEHTLRVFASIACAILLLQGVARAESFDVAQSASKSGQADPHQGADRLFGEIRTYLAATDTGAVSRPRDPASGVLAAASDPPASGSSARAPSYIDPGVCAVCHTQEAQNWAHTTHAKVFTLNPRNALEGQQCQACHGPASEHLRNPLNKTTIIRFTHNGGTPIAQQNAQCLTCHRGGQRIFWSGSAHEGRDVACSDCHNPQANFSARGLTAKRSINETCFQCHATQRAEFRRRSHMPLPEGQISCTDCHNPHGSTTRPLLKANSVNEICYGCHAEKRGPFLFDHAPVRDSCTNCHAPHGSNHEKLLVTAAPLLCQQCHIQPGHDALLMTRGNMAGSSFPDVRLLGRACANCHSQIHGSNSPAGARLQR